MKKLRYLFFILFAISSYGQINFETGYYTNNTNIKTECLIRNVGWYKNPTEIQYKLNENEVEKIVTIADIKEFGIENCCKYKRFKLKIDRSSSDVNNLSTERNPIFNEETLLLKVLVEGEANLYEYQDVNLVRFYISTGNHETVEQLVFKEYKNEDTSQIGENNYYKQQLRNNLKSDQLTLSDFENITYKKTKLVDLFVTFNTTKATKTTILETKKDKSAINLKVIAGVNGTLFTFGNNYNALTDYTFGTKPVFVIGLEVENIFPFNQKKWSIFADPNFQSYKQTEINNSNQSIQADYTFLELPFGARYYMFLNKKSQLFLDAGIAFSVTSKSTIQYSGTALDISNTSNLFTGIGYKSGRYDIELRYNFGRGLLTAYQSWNSNYSSVGILLGYKIL
ncbi:PorT family protein [Flavobacterium sp. N3904]|uniref:PorT family protein n=1 Tax=Flavobacterium sp. N3904 TaxID=2986835 RepID=UPI00222424D5|nr:PorT family protein [Flavobacterium sp. N3904]